MSHHALRAGCTRPGQPPPKLEDYEHARAAFDWSEARQGLHGLPSEGLNIAYEALDAFVDSGHGHQLALRFIDRGRVRTDFSYLELARLASRFANLLEGLGIGAGDRVFTLLGRSPELYPTLFGTLKFGAVFCPLSPEITPEALHERLALGGARVLVTSWAQYLRAVLPVRDRLPGLEFVLLTDMDGSELPAGTASFHELMDGADEEWLIPPTDPGSPALLSFSRETQPRGVLQAHESVVALHATGRYVLDLHPGDVYWCTVDPASASGLYYGAIAPLVSGVTTIVDLRPPDARRWYRILQEEEVNVWYTTPTDIRMLRAQGNALPTSYCYPRLRHIASVGELLDAESVVWGAEIFDIPFHDTWCQAETGAVMIANFRSSLVRPGSIGRPVPGVEAAIVRARWPVAGGEPRLEVVEEAGQQGELAFRAGWPSMFRGYLGDEAGYRRRFAKGWYLTGEAATRDEAGWYWSLGRADEIMRPARVLSRYRGTKTASAAAHVAKAEAVVVGRASANLDSSQNRV